MGSIKRERITQTVVAIDLATEGNQLVIVKNEDLLIMQGEVHLCCPVCCNDKVGPEEVFVLGNRDGNSLSEAAHISSTVQGGLVPSNVKSTDLARASNTRGRGCETFTGFYCESGHTFFLRTRFHKGTTTMDTVSFYSARPPASPL